MILTFGQSLLEAMKPIHFPRSHRSLDVCKKRQSFNRSQPVKTMAYLDLNLNTFLEASVNFALFSL